jgi:hypothetical protein
VSTIERVARRIADLALVSVRMGITQWRVRTRSEAFVVGLLASAGLTAVVLHPFSKTQADLCLAITLYPVTTPAGQLAVLAAAVMFLLGFLWWSNRNTSAAFFRGVLAGNGLILSVDIVWVHWIFGLHHLTNTEMDLILEPALVLLGLIFLWFAITQERRHVQ